MEYSKSAVSMATMLWCRTNHVNLNIGKTKLCNYGSRTILNNNNMLLTLNGQDLICVNQYKYLGVHLDDTMTLSANYNNIFKKFSHKIFQLGKIKNYLHTKTRILVYKQTVLPLVEYVSFLLFFNGKTNTDKLQRLQNRALRLCYDVIDPKTVSTNDLHTRAHLNYLGERRELHLLNLMYDLNPIDPNPAISARAAFPQSGHIRPEKRPFFQKFPHFSKIEPQKKYKPLIGFQYIILKPMKSAI